MIAQNITNLSDARYFAAWGIEYISFNFVPDSPYFIEEKSAQEIRDWVEGPKCLIEANALEFSELADGHILSNIYQSLPMSKEVFYRIPFSDMQKGLVEGKYIVTAQKEDLDPIKHLNPENFLGCDFYLDIANLPIDSFADWPDWPLVVQGGEEEKVGLKSFDQLDQLYNLLLTE